MPKSMLGCHLACNKQRVGAFTVLEAPLFTADKLNVNGEGIPKSELEAIKSRLVGAKIRFCPHGIPEGKVPGVHACGLHEDSESVVAVADSVEVKLDKEGREVVYLRAPLNEGVNPETLPTGWSLLADYKAKDEDGFVYGLENPRIDLTNTPAYEEARFALYPQFAASKQQETNSNINTNSEDNTIKAGTPMPNEPNTDTNNQVAPVVAPATPKEEPVVETPQPSPAAKETLTKDEVTKMFAELTKKFEDEKEKLKEETITATKENIERERRVAEVIANGEKLGTITAENREAKMQRYMSMSKDAFEEVYSDSQAYTAKYTEAVKSRGRSFDEVNLHTPKPPISKEREEGVMHVLKKFGYSDEEAKKAIESTNKYIQ